MIYSTEAIVLKTIDYRETSRIVRFFTRTKGKVSGIMKGVRKDPKKFGSSVDRFSLNDLVYYEYRNTDLHLVSQCDLKQFFFPVRQDYKRLLAANYMIELIDTIMPTEHSNPRIFRLIIEFLTSLEAEKDIDKLIYMLQVKALLFSGFRPHLDACVSCGRRIKGKARFSLKLGGLICYQCRSRDMSFSVISQGAISTILHIERNKWTENMKLGLTKNVRKELKYILNNFLVYHLEKKIKSAKYL